MIIIPIWILAICELIRLFQNMIQFNMLSNDTSKRDNAYQEFINSLKYTDKEFVKRMLEEFEKLEGDNEK